MAELSVNIGSLRLKNPVILASGTCGYGAEINDLIDIDQLGGICVKGLSLKPRSGNPPPRLVETPCGLLNSIGLENVGIEQFIERKLPWLKQRKTAIIVNILGDSIEEYKELSSILDNEDGISAIEVNISCPNVKAGGVSFGSTPESAAHVTEAVKAATRHPVMVKLSPNVTDISQIAKAVEDAGADAISLINTVMGMSIDIETQRPALANIFGGLSGPAIKPIALRMVWQAVEAVDIPVIGMGGITTANDALEFLMAGATAIQVGTGTLIAPDTPLKVLEGINNYMDQKKIGKVKDLAISHGE